MSQLIAIQKLGVPLYRNPPGSIVDGSSTRLPSASSPRTTTLDGVQPVCGGLVESEFDFWRPALNCGQLVRERGELRPQRLDVVFKLGDQRGVFLRLACV